MSNNKHVVFDVVGTLISYEAFFEAIEARLGQRFKQYGISSRLFGYAWMEASEKEYTYISISGKYIKFFDVYRALFYRILLQAGIPEPRKFANDEDREALLLAYRGLKARPGVMECFTKLREGGFTVWAFTSGDTERVTTYLKNGGASLPEENFISCDDIGIGKPDLRAYQHVLDKFPKEDRNIWFAAAHMWDASAAISAGFKGAWVSVWEQDPCQEVFNKMDVTADSLPELAEKIVAAGSK